MDSTEWIKRCAARLHEQWPRVADDELSEVAAQLRHDAERLLDEPEITAAQWLQRAIPSAR